MSALSLGMGVALQGLGRGVAASGPAGPAPTRPAVLVPPRLDGPGVVGVALVLDPGVWTGAPAPALTFRWMRDGAPITGATDTVHVPTVADDQTELSCVVTARNFAGEAQATTSTIFVRYAPPVAAGGLPDVQFVQISGVQTLNASSDFTGARLSFSVQGEGVSIDPATGALSILTDILRDGLEVLVSASNSSGTAASSFRVTIAATTRAPVLISPPALVGEGRIGTEIAVDPGQWQGVPGPDFTFQWRRDGADISGATGRANAPGDADDRADLTCVVTAANVAGTARAETAALQVTQVPPQATGVLEDLALGIDGGVATVAAATAFTGAALSYAVAGAEAVIDAATGVVTIPTNALRTEEAVTVTATNSGGSASVSFPVTVAAEAPTLIAAPTLSGKGRIGAPLTLDPGHWSGTPAPELAFQWRRDGTDIPGAAERVHVPNDADDMADLTCLVTATNLAGSVQAETASVAVRQVAPQAVGAPADVTVAETSGAATVVAGPAFAGAALAFAVTGADAVIDPATGVVTIPTDTPRTNDAVTVTATNSGGSASVSFRVTVTAAPVVEPAPLPDTNWPDDIPAASWAWNEVATDGRRDLTISTNVPAWDTAQFRLLWSDNTVQGGTQSQALKEYLPTERGTAVRKNNVFAAGTRLYCILFWYRVFDDTYRPACADGERTFVVQGYTAPDSPPPPPPPDPVATYGNLSLAAINSAISQPLTTYSTTMSITTNAHAWGQAALALALDAHKGNTRSDSRLEAQIVAILTAGNEPICYAGNMTQMQNRMASALAVVRNTPRIWDSYSTARKNKITSIMKGILLSGAYIASDSNPFNGKRSLTGLTPNVKSSGANIANGPPAAVLCGIAFFGVTTANSLLENYSHSNWLSELNTQNLPNIHRSFNYRALNITTLNATGGLSSNAPTPTQIKDSLTNWRYYTKRISDLTGIMLAEQALTQFLSKTIRTGLNNGAGATADPNFGKMAQDANLLPNIGVANSMFWEFDTVDAEGQRSSGSYATWSLRSWTDAFTALAIAGLWDRSDPALQAILVRFNRAMGDYNFKTSGARYYKSFAHGSGSLTGSTNGTAFGDSRNWTQGTTGLQIDMWGLRYTRELWSIFWNWSQSR